MPDQCVCNLCVCPLGSVYFDGTLEDLPTSLMCNFLLHTHTHTHTHTHLPLCRTAHTHTHRYLSVGLHTHTHLPLCRTAHPYFSPFITTSHPRARTHTHTHLILRLYAPHTPMLIILRENDSLCNRLEKQV